MEIGNEITEENDYYFIEDPRFAETGRKALAGGGNLFLSPYNACEGCCNIYNSSNTCCATCIRKYY